MNLYKLSRQIQKTIPAISDRDAAQLCLILMHHPDDELADASTLETLIKRVRMQLEHSCDQYGAVTQELLELADSDPQSFDQNQIWVLLRAIKIQDQVIKLHVGGEPLNV